MSDGLIEMNELEELSAKVDQLKEKKDKSLLIDYFSEQLDVKRDSLKRRVNRYLASGLSLRDVYRRLEEESGTTD